MFSAHTDGPTFPSPELITRIAHAIETIRGASSRFDSPEASGAHCERLPTLDRLKPSMKDEYGYLWWGVDEPQPGGVDCAMGLGSQYIAVVPALRLVVVLTGGNDYNDKQTAIFNVAERHRMPGIRRRKRSFPGAFH